MPRHHEAVAWCAWQLWCSPAAAKLHNAALPSVPASQSQAPFVSGPASRPSGEGNRRYAKLPSLGTVAQPSALPGRVRALRVASWLPFGYRGTMALARRFAQCSWSVACGQSCYVPRPPCGLAAARHWPCAGLPVRPQGAPSAQRKGSRRLTAAGRQPHFCGANPCNDALVLRPLRGRFLGNELT